MSNKSERSTVLSNMIWRMLEQCGSQGIAFAVSIILARVLAPDDYGTVALITVITSLLNIFINSGMGSALIQKKDADDLDFSTLFYFNLVMCIVLYSMLFFASPLIAAFYNKPELTLMTRVSGLTLIISGVKGIQQSYVSRNMLFKSFFYATLGGTIGAAIIGVWMAYNGFGAWALVIQSLFNHFVDTVILWLAVRWRPKPIFSWSRLKALFSYGSKLLGSYFVDKLYYNARTILVGKLYSSSDLAYYNRGEHYPNLLIGLVETAMDSVLFPVLSKQQDSIESVKSITRRAIKISTYLIMPIMAGFAACAEPLIRIVFTEKWLPMCFYLRLFCISMTFNSVNTANLNAIKALGRSDLFLKLNLIKKAVGIVLILGTTLISVKAVAVGYFMGCILEQIINALPNKRLIGYTYFEQLKDMLPQASLSFIMYVLVSRISFLNIGDWMMLVLQVSAGAIIYILGSICMSIDSYKYVTNILTGYLKQ